MAKRNVSEIETGAGFFMGFVSATMDVVREKAYPFAAIYRLATAGGRTTLVKIVELAHADWLAEQPQQSEVGEPQGDRGGPNGSTLPTDHYRVRLTYAPMPSLASLKAEFGEDRVSIIFDGRAWELHKSCEGMDRTPGERTFCLHDAGRDWEREERIEWGLAQRTATAPNGYRPATHDEEIEFSRAHPELMDYVALGSSPLHGGHRGVAYVWSGGGQRVLGINWLGHRFGARIRGLFVRR